MEEEDNIIVKWAQEDVETSYNLLNKIKNSRGAVVAEDLVNKCVFVVFSLLGGSPSSEFYVPTFRNTLCSIVIGRVNKNLLVPKHDL